MKTKFNPVSDNIIFFDTEYTGNDPAEDEILSIGMVKMDGRELYLELEYEGDYNLWLEENVLPYLTGEKVSKSQAAKLINEFIGETKPYLLSNITTFDAAYLYKIFKFKETRFQEFPLDFSGILFALGLDPYSFVGSAAKAELCKKTGVDISKYKLHNALDDAKLLKEVYLKLVK